MSDILPRLNRDERRMLLDLARRAVSARLNSKPPPLLTDLPPRLSLPQGAFVSLHLWGKLRGCVGMVLPERSLADSVSSCAAAAATEDPRFDALAPAELANVTIEISALDPPFRLADPSRIRIGTHGLLLPQVAVDQGWDVPTFLEETCLKAGLPSDAWTNEAIVEAFSAQVFSEQGLEP